MGNLLPGGSERPKILQLLPADGWREIVWGFGDSGEVEVSTRPIVAWALLEDPATGERRVDCVRREDLLVGSGERSAKERGVSDYFTYDDYELGSLGFVAEGEEVPPDYSLIAEQLAHKEDPDGSSRDRIRRRSEETELQRQKLELARRAVARGGDPAEVVRELGLPEGLIQVLREER